MLEYNDKNSRKNSIINIISNIVVNMVVIIMATRIFKNISVDNIWYLLIVSLLLVILNKSLKPILNLIMLPLNILTLGITYPLVNVLILKFISFILGRHFILSGWFSAFFISIFISIMTIIIDRLIGREIRRV